MGKKGQEQVLHSLCSDFKDTHIERDDKNQLLEFWGERRQVLLEVYFSIGSSAS